MLTTTLLNPQDGYKKVPAFYVINFDDPHCLHLCNHLHPDFGAYIPEAYKSTYTIMLDLNKRPDCIGTNSVITHAPPRFYWDMLDDDFTSDINNSEEPKILVVSNNSDRQAIYEPTLSLYNSCLVKLIDKKDN